ncbi:lysozyme inhibitor LprI family protein [Nitrosomonas sp.]|uniref:lysozyme inhibitor LprI family protein n=1 Tax=Nitrosomonas sp. TaxID=42353 RepID=UPI0028516A2B|nr:lysozyme inhibitor LprI family protein [Nitrosomonas sp.]MDR4513323.1 DUF1311 domain-containing protein [Nitrosomonas sp.]
MNAGNRIPNGPACKPISCICSLVLLCWLCIFSGIVQALDNPDAPDYVGEFNKRAQAYEQDIQQTAQTTQDYLAAYVAYEHFLDKELNHIYRQLIAQLNGETRDALRVSQRKWLQYRDAAFEFIALNWTMESFGSASVISRGDYRTTIIRDRVLLLLNYQQNY